MSIQLDFIKQLTTTKAVKEEANKINKKSIKGTYNTLIDSPFLFGNNRAEFEKLEVGDSQPWNYKEHSYDENLEHNICPECGSSLGRGEGCPKCINCGFSKC